MDTVITIPTDDSWIVPFLAFCQNILKEAVPYTFLIVAAKDGNNKFSEIIAGGLYFGCMHIFSPLSCALANWYSFRLLCVLGPLINAISMLCSHFLYAEEEIELLYIFYSIFGGFGGSMMLVSARLMPSYWFCNKRGLAHCFAYSGQAVGFLIVPNVTIYLFDTAVRKHLKMFFFFSALYVLLVPLGFFCPHSPGVFLHFERPEEEELKTESQASAASRRKMVTFRDEVLARRLANDSEPGIKQLASFKLFKTNHNLIYPRVKDIIGNNDLTLFIPRKEMQMVLEKPWQNGRRSILVEELPEEGMTTRVSGKQQVRLIVVDLHTWKGSRPMYRIDIFYSWDVHDLPIYYRQDNQLDYHLAVTRAISSRDLAQEDQRRKKFCVPEAIIRTLLTMLDYHIYEDHYMIILMVALFLMAVGQMIPIIFLEMSGDELGTDGRTAVLVCGCGQVVGRAVMLVESLHSAGFNYFSCNVGVYVLAGAFTLLVGMLRVPAFVLGIYSLFYGIIHAMTHSIRLSSIFSLSGLVNLTNTVGHGFLWQGTGYIVSSVLSAHLLTKYETTLHLFCLSGIAMLTAGVFLFMGRLVYNYRRRTIVINV